MHRISVRIVLSVAVLLGMVWTTQAAVGPYDASRVPRGPERPNYARPNFMNRVHNAGKMCMNVVNYGYFGNESYTQSTALNDPCPPQNWAPQCEYPCGSGQQYLYQAGLWIGALIVEHGYETKRVSVGTDGWLNPSINEFWPGEGAANGIIERTKRPGYTNCLGEYVTNPDAVSDQDFICTYTDTLNQTPYVIADVIDGRHRPLGIKVTQTSYSFSQAFAEDFILIDYEIQNIAANFLKNLYVGLYVDSDVGVNGYYDEHTDDICGFLQNYYETNNAGQTITTPIDIAWIADNDGRHPTQNGSGALSVPNIAGTRVIRGPNPRLTTSFNWWISNTTVALDYGPSWEDYCARDSMGMGWTEAYGTPMGDEHKYQILSNGEFDFWQIMVDRLSEVSPQNIGTPSAPILKNWCETGASERAQDIADGYDTRYLLSWGPLGIRDYQDASGRWIYRLNPGEKFNMTIAYVCGQNFHDATHPQPSNTNIDSSLFNFADLRENARWAKDVYDNRMRDTPQWDWGNDGNPETVDDDGSQGDGIMDTGDGWYGEDVGSDGLYAELKPGEDSVAVYYFKGRTGPHPEGIFAGYYKGPDADGSERNMLNDPVNNSHLSGASSEDSIILMQDTRSNPFFYNLPKMGFWDMGWMGGNGLMDLGDGIPDFTGPPPPPIPALMHCMDSTANSAANYGGQIRHGCYVGGLGYQLGDDRVSLLWSTTSSERADYRDPFSRMQDFEGYRIHVANVNQDPDYSLLAEFDKIDYAYYSGNDSLMTVPIGPEAYADSIAHGKLHATIANGVESAIGEPGILKGVGLNTGFSQITQNDSTYRFTIPAHKLSPRYYAITAFDYGDPKSGLGPLTTRPTANSVLLAPAGSAKEPVRAVPNPYRAYQDYTAKSGGPNGTSWENMNDGTTEFFQQQDRRIEFINLPEQCLIRIFTVSGDLVSIVPHNQPGDKSSWASLNSERWDLNSRNKQQVVSGIYLFSVEDRTPGSGYEIETGKFVIIR